MVNRSKVPKFPNKKVSNLAHLYRSRARVNGLRNVMDDMNDGPWMDPKGSPTVEYTAYLHCSTAHTWIALKITVPSVLYCPVLCRR